MSTSSLRFYSENPETGKFEELLPAMLGRNYEEASAGRVGVLMANMSFGIGQGCGGCPLFDGRRFTATSWSGSLGGDERLLDCPICLSREFACLEKLAAVRKSFTDFRNAAQSTAQFSGQNQAGCIVLLAIPNLVCDCALSLAGLRFVLVIQLIRSQAWAVTRPEYWWLVSKKSNMWKAWVTKFLGGDASLLFIVHKKGKEKIMTEILRRKRLDGKLAVAWEWDKWLQYYNWYGKTWSLSGNKKVQANLVLVMWKSSKGI